MPLMARFAFAHLRAVRPRAASRRAVAAPLPRTRRRPRRLLDAIEALLGLDAAGAPAALRYADAAARPAARRCALSRRAAGDDAARRLPARRRHRAPRPGSRPLLQERAAGAGLRPLAAGGRRDSRRCRWRRAAGRSAAASTSARARSRRLPCHGLSAPVEAMLQGLQAELKCGTNCGSCLPELRRIVAAAPAARARPQAVGEPS